MTDVDQIKQHFTQAFTHLSAGDIKAAGRSIMEAEILLNNMSLSARGLGTAMQQAGGAQAKHQHKWSKDILTAAPQPPAQHLNRIVAECYQVIGVLAHEAGRFDDEAVTKALDNASAAELVHEDVLPFPSRQPPSQEARGLGITSKQITLTDEQREMLTAKNVSVIPGTAAPHP